MATRRAFNFPLSVPSWHIGHMAKALREMNQRIKDTDVVIEARDARLPLSSINPAFEDMLLQNFPVNQTQSTRPMPHRLIVYNKKDLADQKLEQPLREAFARNGQSILFTNSRVDKDISNLLRQAIELARSGAERHPSSMSNSNRSGPKISDSIDQGLKIMVCGMPNVGKSSLLNALRRVGCHKGKAASEAPMPGHTRSLGGMVKISEPSQLSAGKPVYIFDTPGIMPVFLGRGDEAAARAFKIALTGRRISPWMMRKTRANELFLIAGSKDSLFDSFDLSAYLLHLLLIRYSRPPHTLSEIFNILSIQASIDLEPIVSDPKIPLPTEDFLELIARRIKALEQGGIPNLDSASQWLLKCFRAGRFGQWTLDDVGQYSRNLLPPKKFQSESDFTQDISTQHTIDEIKFRSLVTTKIVSDWFLLSAHVRPQSRTAIKMAERRKVKSVQRSISLSQLKKRKDK
ncbi:hypothetical protein CROQUDRAFT_132064 [Cronartium quercuum f. sp. fusiforme G11]|uniref:G domain-containing protein n=1 Tax=Cronartium quercuum f. sp. fusiforme G11 TaxID=708437 RepID=A0A9P6TDY0_9BASI|nr:hypothetical protein CROQUDRAFT_132064 [Cronartium quercuum f. sp. fusiforme G11]